MTTAHLLTATNAIICSRNCGYYHVCQKPCNVETMQLLPDQEMEILGTRVRTVCELTAFDTVKDADPRSEVFTCLLTLMADKQNDKYYFSLRYNHPELNEFLDDLDCPMTGYKAFRKDDHQIRILTDNIDDEKAISVDIPSQAVNLYVTLHQTLYRFNISFKCQIPTQSIATTSTRYKQILTFLKGNKFPKYRITCSEQLREINKIDNLFCYVTITMKNPEIEVEDYRDVLASVLLTKDGVCIKRIMIQKAKSKKRTQDQVGYNAAKNVESTRPEESYSYDKFARRVDIRDSEGVIKFVYQDVVVKNQRAHNVVREIYIRPDPFDCKAKEFVNVFNNMRSYYLASGESYATAIQEIDATFPFQLAAFVRIDGLYQGTVITGSNKPAIIDFNFDDGIGKIVIQMLDLSFEPSSDVKIYNISTFKPYLHIDYINEMIAIDLVAPDNCSGKTGAVVCDPTNEILTIEPSLRKLKQKGIKDFSTLVEKYLNICNYARPEDPSQPCFHLLLNDVIGAPSNFVLAAKGGKRAYHLAATKIALGTGSDRNVPVPTDQDLHLIDWFEL